MGDDRPARLIGPKNKKRPWKVLCDGEGFLRSKAAQKSYSAHHIELWSVPPRSPDLNPIEKFWAYVRKQLRAMDLRDLNRKRKALTKPQYIARVRMILKTKGAQTKAANIAKGLRNVCREVVEKKGAASRG